jgi:hypothetical protein
MGRAGIVAAMNQGGDRPDIGPVSEPAANWLVSGTNASTTLAQGEAIGSADLCLRDPTTHQPLNLTVAPYLTITMANASGGTPYVPKGNPAVLNWDNGHHPQNSIVPFLMTGDVYYLEHTQFTANRCFLFKSYQTRYGDGGRYFAWPLRSSLMAEKATPATVPGWLLPKSVFTTHVERYRQAVIGDMADTGNALAVFKSRSYPGSPDDKPPFPTGTVGTTWSDTYETIIYALAVQHGHTDWEPQLLWHATAIINRCSATSGAFRSTPNPFRHLMHYTANLIEAVTTTSAVLKLDSYSAAPWPTPPFNIMWCQQGATEVMTVTSISGNEFTVTRDVSGTPVTRPIGHSIKTVQQFSTYAEFAARYASYPDQYYGKNPADPTGIALLRADANPNYTTYAITALAMVTSLGLSNASDAETAHDWLRPQWNGVKSSTHTSFRQFDVKKTAP